MTIAPRMAEQGPVWAALPIAAFLLDWDNAIVEINPAAEAFLNMGNRSCAGKRVTDCLEFNTDIDNSLDRARRGQSVLVQHDLGLAVGANEPVYCDIQIAPISGEAGRMLLLMQPRQIKTRLGNTLHAQSAAKTAIGLADMLAHEIKNPLAGITGAAQLLAMSLGKADQEMTDLILHETRRIVDLLKQVEQFGDQRPPKKSAVNIHDVLERARLSAQLGTATHMRFKDDYDPSLPLAKADPDQLLQVFANLFTNAAQAANAPDGTGTIRIRTYFEMGLRIPAENGGHAVPLQIEISDDGPGVDASILERVFEPFVSTRENGTGLGLALVSKIISDHAGAITVTSRPGLTRFRISLPVMSRAKETV